MYEPNNEQIQAVIISQDIMETLGAVSLEINAEHMPVQIAATSMFCQKTGHKIGTRDENSLFSLLKLHGKEYAIWALYNATSLNVHPAWIDTGPDELDDLLEKDPIGYACYCFGIITAQFYQTPKNSDPKRMVFADRYWSLARANALMHQQGSSGLTELNHALARLITFMPDASKLLWRRIRQFAETPDTLAILHVSGELTDLLNEATNKTLDSIGYSQAYIKRTRFVDIPTTPEDAARGPSNVRKQRVSRRSVAEASVFGELAKLFQDSGLDLKADNLVGSTAWRKKWQERQPQENAAETDMLSDYANALELSNLMTPEETDEDDQEIEVRTLPITPATFGSEGNTLQTTQTEQTSIISINTENIKPYNIEQFESECLGEATFITEPQPQKPMTALERIRAMRKGNK